MCLIKKLMHEADDMDEEQITSTKAQQTEPGP